MTADTLAYLLGLASMQRRKKEREHEYLAQRPGQTVEEFEEFRARHAAKIKFARAVEDELILLVAALDLTLLRARARERLYELQDELKLQLQLRDLSRHESPFSDVGPHGEDLQ